MIRELVFLKVDAETGAVLETSLFFGDCFEPGDDTYVDHDWEDRGR